MYRSAAATQQDVYNVRNKIFLFYWMKRLKKSGICGRHFNGKSVEKKTAKKRKCQYVNK